MTFEREAAVALDAVRAAAALCEEVRREMVGPALTKEDKSPVTVADFGAQAILCRRLAREFPEDPVVGEEDSETLRSPAHADALARVTAYVGRHERGATAADVVRWIDHGNGAVGPRFWTLDPIDGTKGFLRGDQYAVALALVAGGDVQVAALACPALPRDPGDPAGPLGVVFTAVRGAGAFARAAGGGEARPIRVADPGRDDAGLRLVESVEKGHGHLSMQERIAASIGFTAEPVRMDSQAKYGAVARGEAALYLRLPSPRTTEYRENIWDHAAGALLVEEAGGRVTDMWGRALDFAGGVRMEENRGVVVSNGRIHDRVLGALSGVFS
jgi:3'(2'), 5'-bisphosphate nucleotidase